ncbi:hypothetical protein C4D60_Mb06t03890 [Musa balbisiana]|uniref:Uncharacterized protein n=1 Tax=Musa balbisiana TaxID=52838 RepID=A0A4S8IKF7_MUSBA|nr:hypothetical protein C4D60_Mb06t03890 [Musa balbisiana]
MHPMGPRPKNVSCRAPSECRSCMHACMGRIRGGCLVFDRLRWPSARLTHLELPLQCAHEVVDEGIPVVAPRIGVDGEESGPSQAPGEVVVDEVVAPHGHHVARLCEEVVGRHAPDLPPYQFLSPLEQFDLLLLLPTSDKESPKMNCTMAQEQRWLETPKRSNMMRATDSFIFLPSMSTDLRASQEADWKTILPHSNKDATPS